ncbi:hypothetical protein L195_g023686 [Trifolium pratense]|uniref:Uncharacterized protein n=1 Tax=Trifolium pratense TaxID=57577 RepID=A0A2K3NBJ5_TRIPR|nr:hypothetical protein L195_g023686 [Trifolium pratense]
MEHGCSLSPLGWNAEMNKDIVEHFIYHELNGENDLELWSTYKLSGDDVWFGALKLDNKVYRFIYSLKLNELFLMGQRDAVVEWEAQGSSVAAASSQ